ncbi:MAG TPA: DUF5979 domain-containing protein [Dokdonella sp.]
MAAFGVLAMLANPAAAQSWATSSSVSATTLSGTLVGQSLTISSMFPSGSPAVGNTLTPVAGINPPFNTYCIWDSAVPQNSAQLWPASASAPTCAQQIILGLNTATLANHERVTVDFGQPLINPHLMIYSLDNSGIDFSSTRTLAGAPAVLAIDYNNAGVYDPIAQTFGTTGTVPIAEGCANNAPPGRACAYVTFVGTYNELTIDFYITSGVQDGIGFNIGADASSPSLGAYKRITGGPVANGDGSFDVTYEVGARNYGLQDVTDFNLSDMLAGIAPAFGTYVATAIPTAAGTYSVPAGVGACQLVAGALVPGATYDPNTAFTGDGANLDLLAAATVVPASSAGTPGEVNCTFTLRFAPAAGQTHFENSGSATGTSDGTPLSDISYDGGDPIGGDPSLPPTDPLNNAPTSLDIARSVTPGIVKSADLTHYLPGVATSVVYTLVVSNSGADGAQNFAIVDTPASGITVDTWTCTVTTAGNPYVGVTTACGAGSGSGALVTTADLQPGAVLTYTVDATISATATGDLTNSASNTPPDDVGCSGTCPAVATSTVTPYPLGTLLVDKTVNGGPAGYSGAFPVTVACTIDGNPVIPLEGGTQSIAAGTGSTGSVSFSGIAQGATCVVSEGALPAPPPSYLFGAPAITQADPIGAAPVTAHVVNTLTLQVAGLTVVKTVAGGPAGFSASFSVSVACTLNGNPVSGIAPGDTQTIAAGTSGSGQVLFTNIPQGALCTVSEGALPGAPLSYIWGAPAITQSGPIAATGSTATVANTLAQQFGELIVTKSVSGGPAGYVGSFQATTQCTLGASAVTPAEGNTQAVTASATAAGSVSFTRIAQGATCVVGEGALPQAPTGYGWGVPAITQPGAAIGASAVTASIANSLSALATSFQLQKTISGGPSAGVSGLFTFTIDCGAAGVFTQSIALQGATSGSVTVAQIPYATTCTFSENSDLPPPADGFSWGTLPSAETLSVTGATVSFINTLTPVGTPLPPTSVPVDARWALLILILLLGSNAAWSRQRGLREGR